MKLITFLKQNKRRKAVIKDIKIAGFHEKQLWSYGVKVACVVLPQGEVHIYEGWNKSPTTARHVYMFLEEFAAYPIPTNRREMQQAFDTGAYKYHNFNLNEEN